MRLKYKDGRRRITRIDELPFVVRRLRRISKESSSNVQQEARADTKKNHATEKKRK